MSTENTVENESNTAASGNVTTHQFQTEVQQLLQLMIHSLYSNKEIFLRELISNASDASDKLRFEALTDASLMEDDGALAIKIAVDKEARTISISDNGIGMNEQEVIENIGTIARSGTKQFIEKLNADESKDSNLIGQFGVGFYSCFLVAEKVDLLTRRAGAAKDQGIKWTSDGSGEYTIEHMTMENRGTTIVLHVGADNDEYLEDFRIRNIIGKYSDHISLPIQLLTTIEPENNEDGTDDSEISDAELQEWQTVNQGSALWARPKSSITQEEYDQFYQSLSYDHEGPMTTLHSRVEGKNEYISLFFIPNKAPYDLWDREQRNGIKLYVRRIFIADDAKKLLPNYLRFVRGLVDSADLPLNVSREFLQQTREIDVIRNASVKKILGEIKKLAKDSEKYDHFWDQYGKVIKEGLVEDLDNKDTLAELMRFSSTHDHAEKQRVSLKDYVARMPEKQKAIYFITADSHSAAQASPHLEIFKKNDIEVLLLSDPVDEWVTSHLTEFEDKPLQSIAKGDLDLGELISKEDEEAQAKKTSDSQPLIDKLKSVLEDAVKEVKVSDRLVDSPACLIADQFDLGGNMQRILQSMGQDAPEAKPILEINIDHQLVKGLNPEADDFADWAHVLFDQAALAEGASLKDPSGFVKRLNKLLSAK